MVTFHGLTPPIKQRSTPITSYMNISSLLPVNAIIPHLQAYDKEQVLRRLSAHAETLCPLFEHEIFSVLVEREHLGCTGMGNGVCIPHGRFDSLKSIYVVFARLDKAIDFGAADGKKVDLVFLLLTPSTADTEHLKALSVISKLLRDKKLCNKLRAAGDAAELHSLIIAEQEN